MKKDKSETFTDKEYYKTDYEKVSKKIDEMSDNLFKKLISATFLK